MVLDFLGTHGQRFINVLAALPSASPSPVELFKHVSTSTQKVAKHVQNWFEVVIVPMLPKASLSAKVIQSRPDLTVQEILTELRAKKALFFSPAEPFNSNQVPKLTESQVLQITPFDFIQAFVENHLYPYLTGEITAENEDQERPVLFSAFLPLYKKEFPDSAHTDDSLQEFLLKAYVREAACGINRKFERRIYPQDDDAEVKMLCAALKHALSIDFKGRDFSESEIQALAKEALQSILSHQKDEASHIRG